MKGDSENKAILKLEKPEFEKESIRKLGSD